MPEGLTWHVTGLWHPDDTILGDMDYYGQVSDPIDGEVDIALNDSRLASVTVSMYDEIVQHLVGKAYSRFLKVYYRDQLVFWGPYKLATGRFGAGTITLNAVDPTLRLIRHFLRRGDIDSALGADTHDKANVPIDHIGLRLLRDAGLNTDGQNTDNVPDVGIIDGSNDFPVAAASELMGVARGDQVFNSMVALSQTLGPDFELEPVADTVGAYAKLNTYDGQGSDLTSTVKLHYGTGLQNLEDLEYTEGSQYTTHAHVLSRDLKRRVTIANAAASGDTGPYVDWDVTDYDTNRIDPADADAVLTAFGQEVLKAYSRPLVTCSLTLPTETDDSYIYGVDYAIGDSIEVAGRKGFCELEEAAYRITGVRLKQANASNAVRPEIETVPDRVAAAGDDIDLPED